MRVHHLNVGALQPFGGALFDGRTPLLARATMTCHCLLLEADGGLVLVDTGTVAQDAVASAERLGPVITTMFGVRLIPAEAAANQIRRLGHHPAEVKHIVMTHLDFDHAAGLVDFPAARVHLSPAEADAAKHPGRKDRIRYKPSQWGDTSRFVTGGGVDADWFGLKSTKLNGVGGVRLVWLPGHTKGHCGVAIEEDGGWLLHAGDAIINLRELDPESPSTPTGARMLQWSLEASQVQRRRSLAGLRRLRQEHPDIEIICTHDPAAFASLSQTEAPAV